MDRVIDINVRGTLVATQAALKDAASRMVSEIPKTAPPPNGFATASPSYYMRIHITRVRFMNPAGIGGRLKPRRARHWSTVTTREEIEMPLAKIHVLEGQYDEARLS